MKSTLRDENLKNITISESILTEIDEKLKNIVRQENDKTSEDNKKLWVNYVVRFDKKGRSLFSYDEAIILYKTAGNVERFIFIVECFQSFQNRLFGKSIDIRFDGPDMNNCRISVQGDDSHWVDSTYSNLMDVTKKYKNHNAIVRNLATPFLVQIVGVFLGILLSIKGAQLLAPKLKIEYALPFAFVIVFLIFSNIWTYLYPAILRGIDKLWPNIVFKEKQNVPLIVLQWFMKVIFGAIVLAGVSTIFSLLAKLWNSVFQ